MKLQTPPNSILQLIIDQIYLNTIFGEDFSSEFLFFENNPVKQFKNNKGRKPWLQEAFNPSTGELSWESRVWGYPGL